MRNYPDGWGLSPRYPDGWGKRPTRKPFPTPVSDPWE